MLFHREKIQKSNIEKRSLSSVPIIPRQHTSLMPVRTWNCERAALCTSYRSYSLQQASMTVEAAVILPLFLIAMLTLVCVIDVCRIYMEQQNAMAENAMKLAVYAYGAGESAEEMYTYVDLYEVYPCELSVCLIPGYQIKLAVRGRVYPWIGRSEALCEADRDLVSEEMVYITENGSVYHTHAGCNYLDLTVYAIENEHLSSARNKSGSRYDACSYCCGRTDEPNICYISPYGECYHSSRSCSGLTRNVQMVRRSEVSHLPCCSKCQGG